MGFGTWLWEQDLAYLWDYGHWLVGAAVLLHAIWRWHNDPPDVRGEAAPGPHLAAFFRERDAVLGLAGGIAVVAAILMVIAALD